jgi:uncharacterized protein (TIGR02118 family)
MIKVSVLYAGSPALRFDMGYYRQRHMPMAKDLLGDGCTGYMVERGISGRQPDQPPPYVAAGHFYFVSVNDFQRLFVPHIPQLKSDIPNFTDIAPQVQISEIIADMRGAS